MSGRWVSAVLLALAFMAGCAVPAGGPEGASGQDPATTLPPAPQSAEDSRPVLPGLPFAPSKATQVSGGSEPEIVTDRNGEYVWIGDSSGGYWSDNNGTNWNGMGNYVGGSNVVVFDGWTLAQDDAGNLYAGVLRDNRVDVVRSDNGGRTWNQVGYAAGVSGTADRPWLAAKGDGEVALFYFDAPTVLVGFSEHCARSTDGGLTFPDRDPVAVLPGTGGSAFYDSQGRLYFSSNTGNLQRFDSTCIAGATSVPMGSNMGVDNMVQAAADGTDLYMASATSSSAAITLFGSHGGVGSVKSLVVSPPELQSNTYAAVDARNGQVAVAWYGSTTAGDPSAAGFAGEFHTYLAVVDGFWGAAPTITRYQLTTTPNHEGQICMGGVLCDNDVRGLLDYFKLAYDVWGGIHVAFVDDLDGSPNVLYTHVPPKKPANSGPQAPRADFSVRLQDRNATADGSTSTSPVNSLLTYRWDWGDGGTSGGVRSEHTYSEYGSYEVTLTVTDTAGRTGTHKVLLIVDGTSVGTPIAAWEMEPSEPMEGEPVTFRDRSEAIGTTIRRATWDFGDGGRAEGFEVQHTFDAPGPYMVQLQVEDERGATDSLAREVFVLHMDSFTAPPSVTSKPSAVPVSTLLAALAAAVLIARRR